MTRRDSPTCTTPAMLAAGDAVEVTLGAAFSDAPAVVAQIVDTPAAGRVEVTSISATGCSVEAFNAVDESVAATVCWHALGV